MKDLCEHGRVVGHACHDCQSGTAEDTYANDVQETWEGAVEWGDIMSEEKIAPEFFEREPTGLDAPYYDLPANIHSAQDLIEYLDLDFANGNILKSLIRENGSQTKATDELYEAEKRYYFAERHLRNVQRKQACRRRLPDDAEEKS